MSPWLPAYSDLGKHKKTLALARILKVERRYAVGLLLDFWWWGLDNADSDGNLNGLTPQDIAVALDWPMKKAQALIDALREAGWIETHDSTYVIHDWSDYTGALNEKRQFQKEQNKIRQQKRRKRLASQNMDEESPVTKNNQHVTRDIPFKNSDCNAPTVQNTTVQYKNKLSDNNNPVPYTEESATESEMRDLTIVGEAFQNGVKDVVSSHDSESLQALIKKYSVSRVLAAIDEAKKCKGHSAAYVKRVLEGWERDEKSPPGQSSGPDLMDPERYKNFGK